MRLNTAESLEAEAARLELRRPSPQQPAKSRLSHLVDDQSWGIGRHCSRPLDVAAYAPMSGVYPLKSTALILALAGERGGALADARSAHGDYAVKSM